MYVNGPALGTTPLGDVGFSLKRPRWVRKLRPSKWKPKDFAKAAGVIAAAATAPLWAPVAAGYAVTAGGAVAKLLASTGRQAAADAVKNRTLINRAATALVKSPGTSFEPIQTFAPTTLSEPPSTPPAKSSNLVPLVVGVAVLLFLVSQRKGR